MIGLLLGLMMEGNLVRTWQLGGGSLWPIVERPISLTIIAIIIASGVGMYFFAKRRQTMNLPETPISAG